jgi:hypothetical protein
LLGAGTGAIISAIYIEAKIKRRERDEHGHHKN